MKLHATLDRLEELLGSKANTLPRWQRSSNWVGSLGCVEDAEVYCYVSASNNKVLAMVECSDIIVVKKRRETEIKILLVSSMLWAVIGDLRADDVIGIGVWWSAAAVNVLDYTYD